MEVYWKQCVNVDMACLQVRSLTVATVFDLFFPGQSGSGVGCPREVNNCRRCMIQQGMKWRELRVGNIACHWGWVYYIHRKWKKV